VNSAPAAPRPAATVVLLRDGAEHLEVFLQRRVDGMAFAPGMTVFPGGRLDRADLGASPNRWHGPSPDWWSQRLGCPAEQAGGLVVAAIRETLEESGVLLAGPGPDTVITDPGTLRRCRAGLAAGQAMTDVLADAGLRLRTDLLAPWAEWITPEDEPRRYDAWFFLAACPDGQQPDGATGEVAEAGWWPVRTALEHWRGGRLKLMPPTWVTLEQLAELPDVAAALAAAQRRTIRPIMPVLRSEHGRPVVELPDGGRWPVPDGMR
jgi:8-oxo-dGTP pyrophosphatase MutT (NUDIX family)